MIIKTRFNWLVKLNICKKNIKSQQKLNVI